MVAFAADQTVTFASDPTVTELLKKLNATPGASPRTRPDGSAMPPPPATNFGATSAASSN